MKGFHAGALFSKIFIISVFWHMEICLLSDLRLTPACLNIVLRGLDTEHRLLTAVLLALDASRLASSSLVICGSSTYVCFVVFTAPVSWLYHAWLFTLADFVSTLVSWSYHAWLFSLVDCVSTPVIVLWKVL